MSTVSRYQNLRVEKFLSASIVLRQNRINIRLVEIYQKKFDVFKLLAYEIMLFGRFVRYHLYDPHFFSTCNVNNFTFVLYFLYLVFLIFISCGCEYHRFQLYSIVISIFLCELFFCIQSVCYAKCGKIESTPDRYL